MDPIQIALIVLIVAGAWAVVELALVFRRTRGTVDTLDKTMGKLNDTIDDVRPVINKLDETVENLQPAIQQVEPLLQRSTIAVEALSADLIEVNGVLRDVSQITGGVSTASGAMSNIAGAATEKVQKLFNKKHHDEPASRDRTLTESAGAGSLHADTPSEKMDEHQDEMTDVATSDKSYYTYDADRAASGSEDDHE